jgi:hypothetical protein
MGKGLKMLLKIEAGEFQLEGMIEELNYRH